MKLNQVIEKEITEITSKYGQVHLSRQIRKLIENIIQDNYTEQDIEDLIENIVLGPTNEASL